jgi:nucleoside-diphosphate-sugar epimerase
MGLLNIAILGANSHIAKGLINNFLTADNDDVLHLFTRSALATRQFLNLLGRGVHPRCLIIEGYKDFLICNYDVIINCVGAGTPAQLCGDYSVWFTLTEEFDNLCINYLKRHQETLYINFSSGGVYGGDCSAAAGQDSLSCFKVNQIHSKDYYAIVRLNSEAKHRSFSGLRIVDIRIFAYFSRFIDLQSGYFMSELLNALITHKVFKTNSGSMVRDYIHPKDLFRLIYCCIGTGHTNAAFDAVSTSAVEKFEVIEYFAEKYKLRYEVDSKLQFKSPNGAKNIYCSKYNAAAQIGYTPEFSAMETIRDEAACILNPMNEV